MAEILPSNLHAYQYAWVYVCHEIMFLMWQEILHPVQGVYSLTWLQPDLVTA
jgi:hypothetical protein